MKIIEYNTFKDKEHIIKQIETYEWGAAKFLADLLKQNRLEETLGGWANLFLLTEQNELVSFLVFSAQDCIDDKNLTPWIGFFHTAPKYRNHRYGKLLIDYTSKKAKSLGYNTIYLATDHIGLYEKYGFTYLENRIDVWNEDSRIYTLSI